MSRWQRYSIASVIDRPFSSQGNLFVLNLLHWYHGHTGTVDFIRRLSRARPHRFQARDRACVAEHGAREGDLQAEE